MVPVGGWIAEHKKIKNKSKQDKKKIEIWYENIKNLGATFQRVDCRGLFRSKTFPGCYDPVSSFYDSAFSSFQKRKKEKKWKKRGEKEG